MPQPHHLRSPFVLEAVRIQPSTPAAGCPARSVALSGGPGQCYRKLGTPVTITSAAVSSHLPTPPPGQETPQYGFIITVPAADQAALTAVTTTAADAHGYLSISIAGRTWLLPRVIRPFTSPHFEIAFPSRNQVFQLHRLLVPSGLSRQRPDTARSERAPVIAIAERPPARWDRDAGSPALRCRAA